MEEMEILGIKPDFQGQVPVVLLREKAGRHRHLPIFIGAPEAMAIQLAVDGVETPRPMTHDLMRDLITALGATVERVVITDLADGVFFADLHLKRGEEERVVSSRPSDAIALAVRMEIPVYCVPDVLNDAAVMLEETVTADREEVVEEFRQFIESVRPEDFES